MFRIKNRSLVVTYTARGWNIITFIVFYTIDCEQILIHFHSSSFRNPIHPKALHTMNAGAWFLMFF